MNLARKRKKFAGNCPFRFRKNNKKTLFSGFSKPKKEGLKEIYFFFFPFFFFAIVAFRKRFKIVFGARE